jgi:hypothetical protein
VTDFFSFLFSNADDDSDDDGSVAWAKKRLKLNAASKALAIRWLRMARARAVGGGSEEDKKMRERLTGGRPKKGKNKNKEFGTKNRSGKKSILLLY